MSGHTNVRWQRLDQRRLVKRPVPKNKLSEEEKEEIITVVKQEDFVDLPPTQIVPKLADQGTYIASESTFYRVLREKKMKTIGGVVRNPNGNCRKAILHCP
ncbi:helix-turn-helix domain-containing protein [Sporosarcina sp. ITBMC105]